MKTIILRDIPPELASRIESQAKRDGASVEETVINLLLAAPETLEDGRKIYHDLDFLIGTASAEDAEVLNDVLKDLRRIEPEMWN